MAVCAAAFAFEGLAQVQSHEMFPLLEESRYIEPGGSVSCDVVVADKGYPVKHTLRVVGGVSMPGRFAARGETLFRAAEYLIDDRLDSANVMRDRYSLYFDGENDAFEREAYYRVKGSMLREGELTVETAVKRNGLRVGANGFFGVRMEIFRKHDGRHDDEIYYTPDEIIEIPFGEGSGDFAVVSETVELPSDVANVLLSVGGMGFSGEVWAEAPRLLQDGSTVEMPFVPFDSRPDRNDYWVGVNLSSRSWPMWRLDVDGEKVFEGRLFDRASDIADFYIPLPRPIDRRGELTLTLVEQPHVRQFGYDLKRIQLIEESAREVEIVSVPKFITLGEKSAVLLEVNDPDAKITIGAGEGVEVLEPELNAPEKGLYAVEIRATSAKHDIPVTATCGNGVLTANVEQVIEKEPDGVYISSGDEMHIDKTVKDYDPFFKWYVSQRVGNWYQFRPSYQWSGVRRTGEDFVKHYTEILNKLQMPYAWQVEGRTLAGHDINPPTEWLTSPMFRGRQAHENDGAYYYWRHFKYEGLYSDMAARARPYGGIFAKHPPIYTDHGTFIHYDPRGVADMADGAAKYVANLAYSRGESTRHTGPSTTFRYLYQAGYEWLGAEQMYGPEETVMSALRGASLAYGKKDYGTLHAVQWGSHPFADPLHSLRFYLSLAVAYIHGASHINTEEGLWTDEYANDRYTEAGRQHMYAQHRMLDYIETHTRRGEQVREIGVLQGRNDPWKLFRRGPIWSQADERWAFNEATKSFDLLKVFYPGNNIDASGPDGWFTETPYGPVDILPIEAEQELMNDYRALVFLGWNNYDEGDFVKLRRFVEQGGTLILSAAHFNTSTAPDAAPVPPSVDKALRSLLGSNYKKLTATTHITRGKGRVIYFPENLYPADDAIRAEYEKAMRTVAEESVAVEKAGRGWVAPSEGVGFTVWDSPDRRTIYLLNVDWKKDETKTATVCVGGKEFRVAVPHYSIATVHIFEKHSLFLEGNTADILGYDLRRGRVRIQTTGPDTLRLFDHDSGKIDTVPIAEAGIIEIVLPAEVVSGSSSSSSQYVY